MTFKSEISQIIGAKKATKATIALEKLTGTPLFIKLVFRLNLTITTQKSVSIFIPRQNKNPI